MATLTNIRQRYSVPARRGMQARDIYNGNIGVITGAPRSYMRVNIRSADGNIQSYHPFELDYLVGDKWVSGEDLKNKYDSRWDAWNKRANELIAASR